MPRNGRIRIAGKRERWEAEEREEALRELGRELRCAWRRPQTALRDEPKGDGCERSEDVGDA